MAGLVRNSLLAAAIFVSSGVAASHAEDRKPDPLGLTFISSNAIYWDLDVGIEQGFFKAEGFSPEIISTQSSPQSMQMLIGGSVQMAFSQPDPLISAITKGSTELGIIAVPGNAPDWFLVGRKGLDKLDDLKGQTIGFSALKVGEAYLTEDLMKAHGFAPTDYAEIQVGPTPAKFAALDRGSIGASILFQPTATEAQVKGFPVLARFATEMKDYPSIVYLVSRSWAATDQHGIRFSRALRKAHEWLYDPANKAQAISVLQKYSKLDPDVIAKVYDLYFVTDKLYTRDGAVDLGAMKQTVDVIARHMGITAGSTPTAEQYLIKPADGGLQH